MRKPSVIAALMMTAICSASGSYFVAEMQHDKQAFADRRENYTDRGRICIEAACMIHNGDTEQAREYLESNAVHAINGVPMGCIFEELLPKSQALMVSAKRYEMVYPGTNFQIDRLMKRVPDNHPDLSTAVKAATSPTL